VAEITVKGLHVIYVLYPFVTCLLTLPRVILMINANIVGVNFLLLISNRVKLKSKFANDGMDFKLKISFVW
jgi:hypothetical protein